MTTSQAHVRSSRRQHAPGRPSRPTLTQRHSNNARSHRPASSKGKAEITVENLDEVDDYDDAMANTFLQYCAVCDKQILVPSASVLYCSQGCRQSDTTNSPSYTIFKSDSTPPPPAKSVNATSPQARDIVPQLSPTITNQRPVYASHTSTESFTSDSDSTSASYQSRSHRPSTSRTDSEAARYLGQFQSGDRPLSQPRYSRSSGNVTPLLSTTPTSTSSAGASVPYTPTSSQAPLPPRNARWSYASFSNRSVNLITPITYYSTAPSSLTTVTDKMAGTSIDDGSSTPTLAVSPPTTDGISYEKRRTISGPTMSPGRSSLKQLFKFDEMRSMPTPNEYHADHTVV